MSWDWEFAFSILPDLLLGLVVTVQATLLGSSVAFSLGLVWAIARRSSYWLISRPVGAVVEFLRGTPLLIQLYFIFYVLPDLGIKLPAFTAGVVGLGIYFSTYASEVYRAGIEGVRKGQWEAATALNLSPTRTWTSVILPQAIPAVIPALGNYLIAMFKDSALLAAITVVELLNAAQEIGADTFRYLEPLTLVAVLFLAISYPSSVMMRRLESRLARFR